MKKNARRNRIRKGGFACFFALLVASVSATSSANPLPLLSAPRLERYSDSLGVGVSLGGPGARQGGGGGKSVRSRRDTIDVCLDYHRLITGIKPAGIFNL